MNRLERIYRIHGLLNHGRPVSMQRLQAALTEVSHATVKRDLAYMRDFMDAPIVYLRTANGYRYDPDAPKFELPGLWFNADELYALLACEQLLEAVQPGVLAPRIGPLRNRIRRLLNESGFESVDVLNKVRLQPIAQRVSDPEKFDQVASALLTERVIEIEYQGRGDDRRTSRRVHPARLLHYRGNWYLLAWCEMVRDYRLFALERIRRTERLDEPARTHDLATLDRLHSSGFGIFGGAANERAVLRFTAHRARWIADEIWHPEQTAVWRDGFYELSVPYSDPRELLLDILRYGPDVEVLAPAALRAMTAERLNRAAQIYQKSVAKGAASAPAAVVNPNYS